MHPIFGKIYMLSCMHKVFIKIKYILDHKPSLRSKKSVLDHVFYYYTIKLEIKTKG